MSNYYPTSFVITATTPLFIIGAYKALNKDKTWKEALLVPTISCLFSLIISNTCEKGVQCGALMGAATAGVLLVADSKLKVEDIVGTVGVAAIASVISLTVVSFISG